MNNYLNIHKPILGNYFERVTKESRFYPTHISLLMALFFYSDSEAPEKSFWVSRPKLMHFSRVRSIATYHKNIRDLVDYGYIEYIPSWHPLKGSRVRLIVESGEHS